MSEPAQHFAYSTQDISQQERFDYWTEVVLKHCIPAQSQCLSSQPFQGELYVNRLGTLDLCSLHSEIHHWDRTAQHVRQAPQDDIWLGFIEHGFGSLSQGGRSTQLHTNDLVLYDAAQGFELEIGGNNNHLLRIPRALVQPHIPDIGHLTAIVLDDSRPGVSPLREMLRHAAHTPTDVQQPHIVERYHDTLIQLLSLSVVTQDFKVVHHEEDLYQKLMRYIAQHLQSPELNLAHLAAVHHVSTRTLTRAFARHQQTPMAVIWQLRLKRCYELLQQGRVQHISQLALDMGFSDFSHFSHAFKKAFGVSAQTLLHQHQHIQ